MRILTYGQAINETLTQEMERDPRVFVYGIGAPDHKRVFGTHDNLVERFPDRVLDAPLSEDALMGFGVGAALAGLRPVNVHIRVDFLLLALNQLVNVAATHRYLTGDPVPLVVRAVVGRGWGQGCHHSKSLHGLFAHVPGLKVALPSTPADAKGLLLAAIRDPDPVIVIEHRWLYWAEGLVPEEATAEPMGKARVLREGDDLTVVATSWMVAEALLAADVMAERAGRHLEVVDPRTLVPLDLDGIARSVDKTGLCLVADNDWLPFGAAAGIAAQVQYRCWGALKGPIYQIGWRHAPIPTARHMENEVYCNARDIIRIASWMTDVDVPDLEGVEFYAHERRFKGPF